MNRAISKFAWAAGFVLALAFTFSCSSDNDDDGGGGTSSSSEDTQGGVSSSSDGSGGNSSSSIVTPTQYYVMIMGNLLNNSYCQFPSNLLGVVMPLTNELSEMANTCLINSERYTNLTSTQVATHLSNNNLSTYAFDFDRRIADSPLNAALLVYTNVNNYLRLLIVGYQ